MSESEEIELEETSRDELSPEQKDMSAEIEDLKEEIQKLQERVFELEQDGREKEMYDQFSNGSNLTY